MLDLALARDNVKVQISVDLSAHLYVCLFNDINDKQRVTVAVK